MQGTAFVEGLLAGFGVLPVDLIVARAYATASAELAKRGTPVDANNLGSPRPRSRTALTCSPSTAISTAYPESSGPQSDPLRPDP